MEERVSANRHLWAAVRGEMGFPALIGRRPFSFQSSASPSAISGQSFFDNFLNYSFY